MSLLYDVVFSSKCTSNHHRIAVDALRHLSGDAAEKWQNLFLHHHQAYLDGAKAPDTDFKDFKNHVLHVQDGYWGGADKAAAQWYDKTLDALRAKKWKDAVYAAGVMSHYVVDPIQPFHTGQTETENVIHRAVEQSFSKSYGAFQEIIEATGGYRDVSLPAGDDWLIKTVRAGADASNPTYNAIIDHYDFKRGAKKPLEGMDDALRNAIAPLVNRAVITVARILDRAFEEAAVKPPFVIATLDGFFGQMTIPIEWIANKMADGKERALVMAMYKEFKKTGKVMKTLPDDDKEVRALYASEVLNVPVSTLDAEMPRAIGTAFGAEITGAAPAPKASAPPKPAPPAPQPKTSAAPAPAPAPEPTPVAKGDPKPKPAPKPRKASVKTVAPEDVVLPGETAKPAPRKRVAKAPAEPEKIADPNSPFAVLAQPPAPPPTAQDDDDLLDAPVLPPPPPGVRLHPDDLIIDAPAIGPKAAARFEAIGLKTVADLLSTTPEEAAKSLRASHMTPPIIRDWQAQALLACTLPNVRSMDAQALVACGVRDPDTLGKQDAKKLLASIEAFFQTPNGKQVARAAKLPTLDTVKAWIEAARKKPERASVAA